jgi:hypothetical protein
MSGTYGLCGRVTRYKSQDPCRVHMNELNSEPDEHEDGNNKRMRREFTHAMPQQPTDTR